jgi:hypothetical protein
MAQQNPKIVTDFYLPPFGLRWRIVKNESPFTEHQLDLTIALTVVASLLWLPRKHRVDFSFLRKPRTFPAIHYSCRHTQRGATQRFSDIALFGLKPTKDKPLMLAQIISCLAHELEHARQYYRRIPVGKRTVHGNRHERFAYRTEYHTMCRILSDPSAVKEFRRIAK